MKSHFLLLILISLVLQNCNVVTSNTLQNENIESDLKKEIEELDKKVLEAITTNNTTILKELMSDTLKQKAENLDQLIEQISGAVKNPEYYVLDQYYIKNSAIGITNTLTSGTNDQNDYTIQYQALNEEMFVSLVISENNSEKFLIMNIYGKYPEGWRLNILQFGQYTIEGKSAPEIYAQAKLKYDKGYFIDAFLEMTLGSQVLNPAKFWKYKKEDEIKEFIEMSNAKVKNEYIFPLTLQELDTKPRVVNIFLQQITEGYFPMIEYLTEIDLSDTSETKLENDRIHNIIGDVFNGIDKNKKYLLYKAYNDLPNGKTAVPTYGFVQAME